LIGPSLMLGALLGGLFSQGALFIAPEYASSAGLYVMLGMCAVMAATLQAPLAALLAILELTANPHIVLPAMLIIVVATLTTSEWFGQSSAFATILKRRGFAYAVDPATQHLQRVGVASVMNREFARLTEQVDMAVAHAALNDKPRWIVVESSRGRLRCVLNATDLRRYLDSDAARDVEQIDLMQVPGLREDVTSVDFQATMFEALQKLDRTGAEAACVRRTTAPMNAPVVGILTRADIEQFARFG
jgi:CIC family chloride channel protein